MDNTEKQAGEQPDVTISGGGTVYLFTPHSDTAREWINSNVSGERQYFGSALVVEHRYALNLAEGMRGDGLTVE